MKSMEQKAAFIEMRAKGLSLQKCAESLQVAKATLCNWNREMEEEIARLKAIELEGLQERYFMAKEARVRRLGDRLQAIEKELDTRGLEDISTVKLLEMSLGLQKELKAEYVEPQFLADEEIESLKRLKIDSMLV